MRGWLLLLALWTLLPSLAVGGAAAWLAVSRSRAAAEGRLLDTARALALALDRQVEVFVSALVTLAASPALDGASVDLAMLRPQADAVAAHLGAPVLMRGPGPEFPLLLSTRWPPDAPPRDMPLPAGPSSVPLVFETGEPAVSPLLRRGAGQPLTAAVLAPVIREGEVRQVLGALLYPEQLSAILRTQIAAEHGSLVATVTDSAEHIAARSESLDTLLGLARPKRETEPTGESGIISGRAMRDGQPVRIAYARLQAAPGWTLWVSQPKTALDAAWVQPAVALGLGALLALTLATAAAVWIARRIAGPLDQLARRAEASSAGAGPPLASIAPTVVQELERLRVALDGADHSLRRRLQAERDIAAALRDSEARFRAMADNIPQLAWMTRPDGWIFWHNQRWYDYTGTTPEQARGWGWQQVLHPDHLARVTAHFRQRLLEGAPWEDTFPLRRHDSTWRWFLSRAMPIRNEAGRVVLWFGTNTDVTEQREAEAALAASEERLRLAIDSTGLAMLDADLSTGVAVASPNLFSMRGLPVPPGGHTTLAALRGTLHPNDRARVLEETARAEREGGPCRITHRIRRADTEEVRWIETISRVRAEADGRRRLVSVHIDVTERIAAEEQRLMLAREVDHRAKNVLAVVQALLALTPSEGPAARRFAEAVAGRVSALARAHALLARERWVGAELRTLVEEELAPYAAGRKDAAVLRGRELRLPPGLAQPLSLVLHELATNAAKYGALSNAAGRVAVSWTISPGQRLELDWKETGGPPLASPPERPGFGSRLVRHTVKHQLHGKSCFDWASTGLRCRIELPLPPDTAEA